MEENLVQIVFDLLRNYRYSREELLEKTGISEEELDFILQGLIDKNFIYRGLDRKYASIRKPYAVGRLEKNAAGQLFVCVDNDDYIIPENKLHGAFRDDVVVIDCNKQIVVGIQKRQNPNLVCDVVVRNNKLALMPFNPPYPLEVRVSDSILANCIVGDRVCAKLSDELGVGNQVKISDVERIGRTTDKFADERAIAIGRGFSDKFPEEALREAEEMPEVVPEEFKVGRVDLTEEQIFTIDSVHTKDMDDAIGVTSNPDGTITAKVNITDGDPFISVHSALFREAMSRATSVYIGEYVEPMFPSKISNGILSLNENEERLTITCEMVFDQRGNVIRHKLYPSVIKSKKKMTYEELNHFLETGDIDDSYYDFFESLDALKKLSDALTRKRKACGAIEFGKAESEPEIDIETGKVKYQKLDRGESEKWIENLMIAANECVASDFFEKGWPFIYRVHEDPDTFKLQRAEGLLKSLNLDVKDLTGAKGRKQLQNVLKRYADSDEYGPIVSRILLRCMPRATYSTKNIGHWALALIVYCHFTSLDRRLPDFIVNKLIHYYIFEEKPDYNINELISQLDNIASHCTYKGRQADEAERDYSKLLAVKFVEENFDQEMEVQIMDVKGKTVEVKLTENNLPGYVTLSSGILKGCSVTQNSKQIILPHKEGALCLGDYLIVKPVKCDRIKRELVFEATQFVKRHPRARVRKKKKKKS